MNEKNYLALLHKIGLSHKKLHFIFKDNCNFSDFYNSISSDLLKKYCFTPKQIDLILNNKIKYNIAMIEKTLKSREVKVITFFDINYPEILKNIPNPPFLFYLRGKIDSSPKIAVVGSRNITNYGKDIISDIVGPLSSYFTIVSGGAAGCDSFSHKIALNNENTTISVIGTGIDVDYPINNKKLYDKIVFDGGGVISIFPIGEPGNGYNFPIRNEIVAGLSNGVLIIEAQIKSGTLITANLALDLGRDLFAVPGNIGNINSCGCNELIKNGNAKLITGVNDILEEYNINFNNNISNKKALVFNNKLEESIYNELLLNNLSINELSIKLNTNISYIGTVLSLMEINKIIKKTDGLKYKVF